MTDFNDDPEHFLDITASTPEHEITLSGGTQRFYNIGEHIFAAAAVPMRQLGWTTFPQERDERRMPSKIDRHALKWSKWYDEGPSIEETARWAAQASNANAAIILGPASGNVFCFDIDIMDPDLSLQVQELAVEILGLTPFRRVGQEPKIALFYRTEPGQLPNNARHAFAHLPGETEKHAIEVLARAKAITAFGYHHKTGRYFSWLGAQPTYYGPEFAPLVTTDQITRFIDACGELRSYVQAQRTVVSSAAGFDGALEVSGEWVIPPNRTKSITFNAGGLIDGGREPWLTDMTYDLVRMNPARVAIADGNDGWIFNQAGVDQATQILLDVAADRMTTAGWKKNLRKEISQKIARSARSLCDGKINYLPKAKKIGGKLYTKNQVTLAADAVEPAVSILPPRDKRQKLDLAAITPVCPVKAQERALKLDRTETAERVSAQVDSALAAFFNSAYDGDPNVLPSIHILKAPTGAGKTTRALKYVALDPRTFSDDALDPDSGDRKGAILVLMPTYQNIDELRTRAEVLNLDPNASDEDLALEAEAKGLMSAKQAEMEITRLRAEAHSAGLRSMKYMGKLAIGCKMEEKMQLVLDAGISGSSLCKSRRPRKELLGGGYDVDDEETVAQAEDGEPKKKPAFVEDLCPHYATCPAITQRADIAKSHVVFLPHSFLSLTIPEELDGVRAVIADERIFTLFVHTSRFKLATLQKPRKEPKLTKIEEKIGIEPMVILDDRRHAAEIAIAELIAGRDPANALAAFTELQPKRTVTGLSLVKTAARVCGSASSTNVQVYPSMTVPELQAVCSQPTGAEVLEEYRFWRIIQDRIEALEKGTALHKRENRLQLLRHAAADGSVTPMIRISWITEPNWPAAPVLLLDASAHEGIISKIFPDRRVVMHDVEADLNLKVIAVIDKAYSTASLVPHVEASETARLQAARLLDLYRDARNNICAWNANGRVLETSMKAVREANSRAFVPPINLDQIHLGAERGLDFAKQHVASIGLGRMELPVWIMDGLAAALAATDPEPAALLDPLGTGCLPDGKPLPQAVGEIVLPMRNGADVTIIGAKNPEGWQRVIQEQFREEGLRQGAIGRMRPVYREDTPTVVLFATCIPEGIIVDEICSRQDLIPAYAPLLDAARWNGGVIDWLLATSTRGDLATRADFKSQFKSLPAELKASYAVVHYNVEGIGVLAGVPAIIEDPVAHLKLQLDRADIKIDAEPVIVRAAPKARVAPAGVREPDALETSLGTAADRRLAEQKAREEALKSLISYEPGKGRFPIGVAMDAKGTRVSLSLTAMALLTYGVKKVETDASGSSALIA